METLNFSVLINCNKQKVWHTMLDADTYPLWIKDSWPDSYYEGNWGLNEEIGFVSASGEGTLVLIEEFKEYEYLLARHVALLGKGGYTDKESDFAKNWINQTESYTFEEKDGVTELSIEIKAQLEWVKMFDDGWPNALTQLKKLCES
jgi:uncharacterized protein YndB with AHSA1/START domain